MAQVQASTKRSQNVSFKGAEVDLADVELELKNDSARENGGNKTPTTPPVASTSNAEWSRTGATSNKEKEKKGHRRVDPDTGVITYKKVPTSTLMGSIQFGIEHCLGKLHAVPYRDILVQDFSVVNSIYFPSDGCDRPGEETRRHSYGDFRFKSYADVAFRHFRQFFKVDEVDFLNSLCATALKELSNPGASGSVFYKTMDDEFIVKTVQRKEAQFLQQLLPGYYMTCSQNPQTLLPKFFGLYCYQRLGVNVRLIVMNNLLPEKLTLHEKYDLKGSTYKRRASEKERAKPIPTLKDLDYLEKNPDQVSLVPSVYEFLMKCLERDCLVLESFKIMDYSLLVGIHNITQARRESSSAEPTSSVDHRPSQASTSTAGDAGEDEPRTKLKRNKSLFKSAYKDVPTDSKSGHAYGDDDDDEDDRQVAGIRATNAKGEELLVFIGIIDILQSYRLFKKMEHSWKSLLHDGDTISVHRPKFYAQRFKDFMRAKVFRPGAAAVDPAHMKTRGSKFKSLVSSFIALKSSPSKKRPKDRRSEAKRGSTISEGGGAAEEQPSTSDFASARQAALRNSLKKSYFNSEIESEAPSTSREKSAAAPSNLFDEGSKSGIRGRAASSESQPREKDDSAAQPEVTRL